jgi:hypothetical protein
MDHFLGGRPINCKFFNFVTAITESSLFFARMARSGEMWEGSPKLLICKDSNGFAGFLRFLRAHVQLKYWFLELH